MRSLAAGMLICLLAAISIGGGSYAADAAPPATQPSTEPSATASPTKFYGVVTAVDTANNTFSIGDQLYTITGETQMTKNNKPATLADAVVGEPARGSYTTGADGKLDVTKVRFGKKSGGKGGGGKHKHSTDDSGAATQPAGNNSSTGQ